MGFNIMGGKLWSKGYYDVIECYDDGKGDEGLGVGV